MTFDEAKKLPGRNVILFYGAACAPCADLKPRLEKFVTERDMRFIAVNVAAELHAARELGIRSVPAIVTASNGLATLLCTGNQTQSDLSAMFGVE